MQGIAGGRGATAILFRDARTDSQVTGISILLQTSKCNSSHRAFERAVSGETMRQRTDVLVIGGGPAGLAAAIAARRKGLEVTVGGGAFSGVSRDCYTSNAASSKDGGTSPGMRSISVLGRAGYRPGGRRCHRFRDVAEDEVDHRSRRDRLAGEPLERLGFQFAGESPICAKAPLSDRAVERLRGGILG